MRTRTAVIVACMVAVTAGCGRGEGAGAVTNEVARVLDATRDVSRSFEYTDETLDGTQRIVVTGRVQDDLRYSGSVSVDGKDLYQQVVSDDSVALRLIDLEATKGVVEAARREDEVTADALAAGRWVVDHTVAPPLLAAQAAVPEEGEQTADDPNAGRRRTNIIGDDPFIDGAQVLNYAERSVRSAFFVERFNPEDIEYNALDDPWRDDAESELDDEGIRRYDLRLPPLPRPAERGRQQQLPTVEHFRKMAIYAKGERAIEIREQISIADRREFRRAEEGRSAEFYLRMRDAARRGSVQDELRERLMNYEVTDVGKIEVALPGDAENGLLAEVLPALRELFDFRFIGGDATPPIVGPGGSPLPLPDAPARQPAASPEASPAS